MAMPNNQITTELTLGELRGLLDSWGATIETAPVDGIRWGFRMRPLDGGHDGVTAYGDDLDGVVVTLLREYRTQVRGGVS